MTRVLFVCSQNRGLAKRFRAHLKGKRIICLEIPDDYGYMEPALVRLLEAKAGRFFQPK